jgi:hypothetical protein
MYFLSLFFSTGWELILVVHSLRLRQLISGDQLYKMWGQIGVPIWAHIICVFLRPSDHLKMMWSLVCQIQTAQRKGHHLGPWAHAAFSLSQRWWNIFMWPPILSLSSNTANMLWACAISLFSATKASFLLFYFIFLSFVSCLLFFAFFF